LLHQHILDWHLDSTWDWHFTKLCKNTLILQAWLVMLFPLHFFFHFLYYTDVGSLTFVIASYLVSPFCLQACHYSQQHAKAMATCLLIFAFYCKL